MTVSYLVHDMFSILQVRSSNLAVARLVDLANAITKIDKRRNILVKPTEIGRLYWAM